MPGENKAKNVVEDNAPIFGRVGGGQALYSGEKSGGVKAVPSRTRRGERVQ